MNLLSIVLGSVFLVLLITGMVFIGFYVVLPLILIGLICSALAALIKVFIPEKSHKNHHFDRSSDEVIDVEYEEIK